MPRDYYEVLGVRRDAADGEIKRAFRGLARELHPDVNSHDPGAEEKFKEVAEAYEVLSDPERRRTYDSFGHEGLRSRGWAPGAGDFGGFSEIFETFFGGDPFGRSRGPAAGADLGTLVEVELEEVLEGTERDISFEAVDTCENCRGNGAEPGTPINTCASCDGSGQVRQVSRSIFGQVVRATVCEACGGEGKVPESPCAACGGSGRLADTRTWAIDVPAGIEDGQRIRIAGAGHAGDPGARSGDLYVEVHVRADERFARQGTELVSRREVPVTTAILGGEIQVPTLDGTESVEVPAGTQHGDITVLKRKGLPPLNGGKRGDQHVVFELIVPTELTGEQAELVRRLDDELGREASAARKRSE